jgi:hypothetical protein
MNNSIITTSWDDGHSLDLKLAKLLSKYRIPATFYVPVKGINKKLNEEQIKLLDREFEIGAHTLNHLNLTKLSREKIKTEIKLGKKYLENLLNREINSFAYPMGLYNKYVEDIAKKHFTICRTTKFLIIKPSENELTSLPTTLKVGPWKLSFLKRIFKNKYFSKGLKLFKKGQLRKNWLGLSNFFLEQVLKEGGIFHLWGHSWEIDKYDNWDMLELLFKKINSIESKNLVKCTNSQLLKHIQ